VRLRTRARDWSTWYHGGVERALASGRVHQYSCSTTITRPAQTRGVDWYDTQRTPCMQPTPAEGTRATPFFVATCIHGFKHQCASVDSCCRAVVSASLCAGALRAATSVRCTGRLPVFGSALHGPGKPVISAPPPRAHTVCSGVTLHRPQPLAAYSSCAQGAASYSQMLMVSRCNERQDLTLPQRPPSGIAVALADPPERNALSLVYQKRQLLPPPWPTGDPWPRRSGAASP